jgi:hypothetical protein
MPECRSPLNPPTGAEQGQLLFACVPDGSQRSRKTFVGTSRCNPEPMKSTQIGALGHIRRQPLKTGRLVERLSSMSNSLVGGQVCRILRIEFANNGDLSFHGADNFSYLPNTGFQGGSILVSTTHFRSRWSYPFHKSHHGSAPSLNRNPEIRRRQSAAPQGNFGAQV